jgi:hypothetical protein
MNDDNTDFVRAHTSSGAEALAQKVPRAEVGVHDKFVRLRS